MPTKTPETPRHLNVPLPSPQFKSPLNPVQVAWHLNGSHNIPANQSMQIGFEKKIREWKEKSNEPLESPPDSKPIKTKAAQWIPETKTAMLMLKPGIKLQRRKMEKRDGTAPYMTVLKSFRDEQ